MQNSVKELLQKLRRYEKVTEADLLVEMSSGYTIFEHAIKVGIQVNCDRFSKVKSLDIILKYGVYDLLKKVDIRTLLKPCKSNINESYLEMLLKEYLRNESINISFINPFDNSTSLKDTAKVYLLYSKYDLVDYLPYLNETMLLSKELDNGKEDFKSLIGNLFFSENRKRTLLEIMLDENKELTINKVLKNGIKRNFDIAMILRAYDINQRCVDYDLKPNNYVKHIITALNNDVNTIPLNREENYLLQTLYNLFIDGSDKEAVMALINSYKVQLKKKKPETIIEIKKLIELKMQGKPSYIRIGGSHYLESENGIEIKNGIIDTVNHEMAHALFHNLTDGSVPDEFWGIIDRVRSNSRTIKKIYEYSRSASENMKKVSDFASLKYEEDFPLMNHIIELYKIRNDLRINYDQKLDNKRIELEKETFKIRKSIGDYLLKSKKEKVSQYKKKGYSEEDISLLFSNSFSIREYALMHKRIQKEEYVDAISSSLLACEIAIGDIIDAIYQGNFLSGNLLYWDMKIMPVSGHGLFYYNYNENTIFDEVLANYRTIMMSENSEEYLNKLRYYVGNELVDFLDNYYKNVLLKGNVKGEEYGR